MAILLSGYSFFNKSAALFSIPTQTINLFKILGDSVRGKDQTIKKFQISELVTYREYKEYLSAIKRDSSESYYQTKLPDSNIGSVEVRNKYITRPDYDDLPVLGVSWDNAMDFCKWKTLMENKDSIRFIYRLPNCSEWLAAYFYLVESNIKNDFNKDYSDWLLNSKDESILGYDKDFFPFNFIYFHKKNEARVLRRKFVIGDSYLFQQEELINYYSFSYYADEGYRQVSFRYIKELLNQSEFVYRGGKTFAANIIEYWGIKK